MDKKIIDISKYNTITSWSQLKQACDGVILRVAVRGYGSGKISTDSKFDEFAKNCNKYGIPWGIYFMSSAINTSEARQEAEFSVTMATKYMMPKLFPIVIDSEDVDGTAAVRRSDGLSKAARTKVVAAFINRVNELGYKGGVYCADSWTREKLNWDDIKNLGFNWIAKYGKNDGSIASIQASPCHMHQYTSKASVPGVKGQCDVSIWYDKAKVDSKKVAEPTVKMGSAGANAKLLQENLNKVNKCKLEIDGIIGKKSDEQIRIFQKNNGLVADGVYGKLSYAAMQKVLGGK